MTLSAVPFVKEMTVPLSTFEDYHLVDLSKHVESKLKGAIDTESDLLFEEAFRQYGAPVERGYIP